jgi:hypothetical protein
MRHIYSVLAAIAGRFGRTWGELLSGLLRFGRLLGVMLVLTITVVGCADRASTSASIPLDAPKTEPIVETRTPPPVTEVSAPILLQKLRSRFERYRPQVAIVSPTPNSVIEQDTVAVTLNVTGLPLFRDDRFGLGPHLHLLLDDQSEQLVFDTSEPIVFTNLTPGTHTLRVFAARPWSESFKNEGAFAQTTFHIYTKTGKNEPDQSRPLLTYNQPCGTYGSEPILLDFYLTNAPLHAIAQEFEDDAIRDWRVRVTVNGQRFMLDRWEPLYLKGVKPGQNWLQLELIDEQGEPIENAFNSTVHLFQYDDQLQDGLAAIVGGEVSFEEALSIAGVEPLSEELTPDESNPEETIDQDMTDPSTVSEPSEPSEPFANDEADPTPENLEPENLEPGTEVNPALSDPANNTQDAELPELDGSTTPIQSPLEVPIGENSTPPSPEETPPQEDTVDTETETPTPELSAPEPRPEERINPEDEAIDPSTINSESSHNLASDETPSAVQPDSETQPSEMLTSPAEALQPIAPEETSSELMDAIADPMPSTEDRDRGSTEPINTPAQKAGNLDLALPVTPDRSNP